MPSPVTGGTGGDALSPVDPARASLLRAVRPVSCLRASSSVGTSRPTHWAPTPSSVCVSTSLRRQPSSQRLEHNRCLIHFPPIESEPPTPQSHCPGGLEADPGVAALRPGRSHLSDRSRDHCSLGVHDGRQGKLHVSRKRSGPLVRSSSWRVREDRPEPGPAWPSDAGPALQAQRVDGKGRPTAAPLPASLASPWAGRCSHQQALTGTSW